MTIRSRQVVLPVTCKYKQFYQMTTITKQMTKGELNARMNQNGEVEIY